MGNESTGKILADILIRYRSGQLGPGTSDSVVAFSRAVERIEQMLSMMGGDVELLSVLLEVLIEHYEELQDRIADNLDRRSMSGIRRCVGELESTVQVVASSSKLRAVDELKLATETSDFRRCYTLWLTLHQKLYPIISLLRFVRRDLAAHATLRHQTA
jgi:hypothetical protein